MTSRSRKAALKTTTDASGILRMKKGRYYFFYLTLLAAILSRMTAFMAGYFLRHDNIYFLASFILFSGTYSASFLVSSRHLQPSGKSELSVLISLLIILVESYLLFFFFAIKPFTPYYEVILFLNLMGVGLITGYYASSVYQKGFDGTYAPNNLDYLIALLLIAVLHIIPFKTEWWPAVPFFVSLAFITTYVYYLLTRDMNLKWMAIPSLVFILLVSYYFLTPSPRFYEKQRFFEDKIVFSAESSEFEITITQWMDDYWVYLDRLKNLSTIDEFLYYEPFAHSGAFLTNPSDVLILGGENGCLIRELLKYKNHPEKIDMVPYDSVLLDIYMTKPYLVSVNNNSLRHAKVNILYTSVESFIEDTDKTYDLVLVDLPDPRTSERNRYYTVEFYEYLKKLINPGGIMITQAGSPYYATLAFLSIERSMQEAGFRTLPIHNQILTLGEWGWIIGSTDRSSLALREQLIRADFSGLETKWLNREAMKLLTSFGKDYVHADTIEVNSMENPVLYRYYLEGNRDLE